MVIDVFASKYVKVNTPTTLNGRSQLGAETMVRDRRNASKRIHVERIVGCAKTFRILKTTPNSEDMSMGGKIMCVLHANQFLAVSRGFKMSLTVSHNQNSLTVMLSKLIQNTN